MIFKGKKMQSSDDLLHLTPDPSQCHKADSAMYHKVAFIAIAVTITVTFLVIFFPDTMPCSMFTVGVESHIYTSPERSSCKDQCRVSLVESIPENLTYPAGSPSHISIFETWMSLIRSSKHTIDIASFYWSLRGSDVWRDPSDWQGEQIFKELMAAGTQRNITIRIAQSQPSKYLPNNDTQTLASAGAAEVRSLDFERWFGSGVLHTKMILVDNKHFYVGSANIDWRSLTQVKELGAVLYNCSCFAEDMQKIFEVYWFMGKPDQSLPHSWPKHYSTSFNHVTPLQVQLNNTRAAVYLASSPPGFCPNGRTNDIDAILDVIGKARKFIYIAVMDYFPTTLYMHPNRFWPVIDDALRRASLERGVEVRIMASWWNHSKPAMVKYLNSIAAVNGAMRAKLRVKLFKVPSYTKAQSRIPFARVNHNKYMVTDNTAYIGTSNWSGDYFINTGGIGLVINETSSDNTVHYGTSDNTVHSGNADSTVQQQLADVFLRDWNSQYAHSLSAFPMTD